MTGNMENLSDWIGRGETTEGLANGKASDVLNATLDRDDAPFQAGDALPPAWHWMFFPEVVKLSDTGPDGHLAKGGFMPPVPLPRRMWAGTKMTFHQPLRAGEKITRVSTVSDVTIKDGSSGALCFVTVRHEISGPNGLATTDEHLTVYRAASEPGAPAPKPQPAPHNPDWSRPIHPTPVMLFRFSALTNNSHRIHYDRSYVTEIEGYPGLLVHGNLTATLLLDLFRREMPHATLKTFNLRAVSPLYDINDFSVSGRIGDDGASGTLWAANHEGALAQQAEITFEA
ncbi:MAG: MaoC family dehydratase N-terminal domain-containing protein [Rhodospirillales bacterium]|nr:MaoC family dehydratase N-terminal domain-containing protein [Rhodospirillales bacterium]